MPSLANDTDDTDDAEALPPDSQFESFFDRDSDKWSLRRIPSTPPACVEEDTN